MIVPPSELIATSMVAARLIWKPTSALSSWSSPLGVKAAGPVPVRETVDGSMREVESLDIPAHGSRVLVSGGNHLMFEKLKRQPQQGEKVTVELHFAESGTVTVEIPVKPATYTPKHGH